MNKILKIFEDRIVIGLENGGVTEVRLSDIDFIPTVGDEVELFNNELTTYCTLKKVTTATTSINPNGINITVQNTQTNTQPQTVFVTQGKLVNKLLYVLLALFLGGIGVHKFYSGKIGTGILYFIFSWTTIPFFIGLIEAVIAMFKPADAQGNIII